MCIRDRVFDSIIGDCSICLSKCGLRIRILILIVCWFIICWFLLEERHVIYKLLKLLMDEIGEEGCLVGRVACSFARQVVLHAIAVFNGHHNFELVLGFGGFWLGPPNFECIAKESSVVNIVVTEVKELGVSDIFVAICGKGLAIL